MKQLRLFLIIMLWGLPALTQTPKEKSAVQQVAAMLDDWYDAADNGDGARYFTHFASDAVFLGTDPEERWSLPEFRTRYEKYFDGHHAWTYRAEERHVIFSKDHKTGWFDEKLKSPTFGELRGTGVVVKSAGVWKIQHYSLSFLIPNAAAQNLMQQPKCQPTWTARCE